MNIQILDSNTARKRDGDVIAKTHKPLNITIELAKQLITEQFSEYAYLPIKEIEKQGHDNRTYRLGNELLIRMPSAAEYALKVAIEHDLLPKLAPHLSFHIPAPMMIGSPSKNYAYPYPFSIYKWLGGKSINLLSLDNKTILQLAFDLATFLKELQSVTNIDGPLPGQHNFWRGAHVNVYDKGARERIEALAADINAEKAINLWKNACNTRWNKPPVWIHGDFAVGNMLMQDGKLSAIIDFGGLSIGDPACDLVIAWTFLSGKAREIFIKEMNLEEDIWLRARAWALWKATFELCHLRDKNSFDALIQKRIIAEVIDES